MSSDFAGFWLRAIAYIIDYIILQLTQSLAVMPLLGLLGFEFSETPELDWSTLGEAQSISQLNSFYAEMAPLLVLGMTISLLYYSLMESSKHQGTIGKMAVGIKVTDLNGIRLNLGLAIIRNVSKIFSALFLMIGYIMAGLTSKKQGLHDMIANTIVIKKN
ncbi:MAG: RDD family protein [Cyclobacteriaceae bacterium]